MNPLPPEDQPDPQPSAAHYVLDSETDNIVAHVQHPIDPAELVGKEGCIGPLVVSFRLPDEPEGDYYVGQDSCLHPAELVADPFPE